jgi:hypothetical protein
MDWIYEKYLRKEELERLKENYQSMKTPCGFKYSSCQNILQSISNESFFPIFGFNQHPNSSEDM